jgi:hypothetical protein
LVWRLQLRRRATIVISGVSVLSALLCAAVVAIAPTDARSSGVLADFARKLEAWLSAESLSPDGEALSRELTLTPVPAALVSAPLAEPPQLAAGHHRALAYAYDSRIFRRPSKKPRAIGLVRRGIALPVKERVHGPGCKRGGWYALLSGGVVCSREDFAISVEALGYDRHQKQPDRAHALPFDYGRVNSRDALRFYRIPTLAEEQAIAAARAAGERLPEVVSRLLDGDYLVAIDRTEPAPDGRSFYRTVRGRYLATRHVDLKPEPAMHGELLGGEFRLPLAFVYGQAEVPLIERVDGGTVEVGTARKHARFNLLRIERWANGEVALGEGGIAVARKHVRIARARRRPDQVEARERWIHVDLDEQALVAYEGDRPVFATLVSSGKDGYETPTGSFQVREKHVSTTMRGEDPVDGPYEVEEVPWTMYYFDSYALHGAYWHDDFGRTRSHGCTNIAPVDARWLFHFTADDVPAGWHARRQLQGTFIELTRSEPAEALSG